MFAIVMALSFGPWLNHASAQDKPDSPSEVTAGETPATEANKPAKEGPLVYVLKVDDGITQAMLFYLRRGVKQAADAGADALVLDMKTPGGRVDVTEEIIDLLGKFEPKGSTYTYVNDEAISAGSFIACATRHIYMAPDGVIGAAAAVMGGGQDLGETMQMKISSYLRAKIRNVARANDHRPDVFEAMIDSNFVLKVDGEVMKPKGELLTLTASEAEEKFGDPPTTLLSAGTVDTLENLVAKIGPNATVITVEPTGYERVAYWITMIAPLLIGFVGILIYLEFQTPGFGIFGTLAIVFVLMFFFGHYVAGLSGNEVWLLFFLGLICLGVEFFLIPGTFAFGVVGLALIFGSLFWAMADYFPTEPLSFENIDLITPVWNLGLAAFITIGGTGVLMAVMPRVVRFSELEEATVKGSGHEPRDTSHLPAIGETGEALTPLRPAGTALFGTKRVDVTSDGQMIARGESVIVLAIEGLHVTVGPAATPTTEETSS